MFDLKSTPDSVHEQLSLQVEKLLWRGRGLSRLDSGQIVILEPGVLPGEKVRAQVLKTNKDYLQAQAVQIISPSTLRLDHPCPHALQCGGSPFGMVSPETGLALKVDILADALTRSLGFETATRIISSLKILPSPKNWRYRWRGQIHVHNQKPHAMAQGSTDLAALNDCLLLAQPLAQAMADLAHDLPNGRHTIAASPDTGQATHEHDPKVLSFSWPEFGLSLNLPASVFFQANWDLNQTLVHEVTGLLDSYDQIADLFSGVGNFALPLASLGKKILAVEGSSVTTQVGLDNAQRLKLARLVTFKNNNLAKPASWRTVAEFAPQAIILDPPRTGAKGIGQLLTDISSVKRLIWVSCDVVNTLRDSRPLLNQGWNISSIMLLDMFPNTWHMEIVLVWDRS